MNTDDTTEQEFEELAKLYPELMERSQQEYIGVDKGWHNIINVLCSCLYNDVEQAKARLEYAKQRGEKEPVDLEIYEKAIARAIDELPVIHQIKEKFGSLRFYAGNCNQKAEALIMFAEALSSVTCEVCGAPGELDTAGGWMKTHCKTHTRKRPFSDET